LRNYNTRYITNNPNTAFTNLRLHTLLRGVIDWIDTARISGGGGGGSLGIDTIYAINDSTIRYRKSGVFRNVVIKGVYDNRRKVDSMYQINDSTIGYKINGVQRTFIVRGSPGWQLTGNADTDPSNFLGTTDEKPLRIATNGVQRILVDSVTGKIAFIQDSDTLYLIPGSENLISASPGTDLSLKTDNALLRIGGAKKFVIGGIDNGGNPATDSFLVRNPVDSLVKAMSTALFATQAALNDSATALRNAIATMLDSTLGVIYQAVGFSNLSDFTNRGATASVVGADISFSGGANNFNQTLEYNIGTLLEQWHQSAVFIPTEKTSTSYGFGLGIRSTNSSAVNVTAKFDATTGSNSGKLLIYAGSNILVKTGETAIAFSANDSLELHVERATDSIYTWIFNRTQKVSSPKLSYGYSFASDATVFTPNTGRFAISSFGGTFKVSELTITSNTPKRPDVLIIGDSKTAGYFANSPFDRWAVMFRKSFPNTVIQAGSADKITDAMARLDETLSILPRQVLLSIGVNDIRVGVDSNTIKSNYTTYVASLQAGGAMVYHLLSMKEVSLNADWFNNFIIRTWPNEYIDSKIQFCNDCLAFDNIHLNNKGNTVVAGAVISSGKLQGQTSVEDNSLNSVLAKGSVSNITPIIGSISRLGGTAAGSFSDPKLILTSSTYPSIVMETGTTNFGGGSIAWKTNRGGPKVNPSLFGDSVAMAMVVHAYDNTARTWALFTATNSSNQVTGFAIRQPDSDFIGTRSRVTAQAGQNLYAGFELAGTVNFNATQAVFAVNAATQPVDFYNLPSVSIDTTTYKPLVRRSDGRTYTSYWPVYGGGGAGTVTDFTFTDGNGFDGTVSTSTSTPTLSITTSLTTGSVPFIGAGGALSEDNANHFWDNSNKRQSIGAGTSPSARLHINSDALGGTTTGTSLNSSGIFLSSTTAATNGAQQMSPAIVMRGNGYGTTGSASQTVDWKMQVLPIQGTTPSAQLVFSPSINGATYTSPINFTSGGMINAGTLVTTGAIVTGSASFLGWQGRSTMYSPANGNIRLTNQAGTDFGLLIFGDATSSFPALQRSGSGLILRLGDNSADAPLTASGLTLSGLTGTGTRLSTTSSTGVSGAITNGSDGQVMTMVSGSPAWTNKDFESGTYTPTVSGLTNVTSNTPQNATWMRVGNTVTVAGAIDIGTASIGTVFSLFLSLPIASNFTGYDGGGTGGYALGTNCYTLTTNVANDVMQLQGTSENTGMTITYHFTYTIK
jgi:lysophospholipase L1-like esterase